MKIIEINYNPYKMSTEMLIDGIDVCQDSSYSRIKNFIEQGTPLQTWIEPLPYLSWYGFVNEITDPEVNDEINIVFSGRVIDFQDLKHAIAVQNEERPIRTRVRFHYEHKKVLDDKILSQSIEEVVNELKSDRFRSLVKKRTTKGLTEKYNKLEMNYALAKESEFYIIFAGVYSSGKSTLLNTLIRHNILPTSNRTCTSKNCRIRHDSTLGNKISLAGYDAQKTAVYEKQIFDNDFDCAKAFAEICPIKNKGDENSYPDVVVMELCVDLSHLYPESVNKDKFTLVLIDTPGMDSAQSSADGNNKHTEIALDAISMDSKPMIILCADANKYEDKNIGEFMKKIIAQSKEDGSGFNDRFLFLMNKNDTINYSKNEPAEKAKATFAEYLTDSTKWNIKNYEEELKLLANNASLFVPRVFMTAARIELAIQCKAFDFKEEELRKDPDKCDLYDRYKSFSKKICIYQFPDFYLSRYCDLPGYRKDEIEESFNAALKSGDHVRATQLQCGLISVEYAIKDYIERYAYPIKVRGLLDTFEDILEDVNSFETGILDDLKQAKKNLMEKEIEKKEVNKRRQCVKDKIATLEKAKTECNRQLQALNEINFDSNSLMSAIGEFRADIESDGSIRFVRNNPIVKTGQKTHREVELEISSKISNIKELFDRMLTKTNQKLEEIKRVHDKQILEIYDLLKDEITKLENSGVFLQNGYNFTNSVSWNMSFANIDSEQLAADMKKNIVEKIAKEEQVRNYKRDQWKSSWNPFKKIGSWFMEDYSTVIKNVDGFYRTDDICKSIDSYLLDLQRESKNIEKTFKEILETSKEQVRAMTNNLLIELAQFLEDVGGQEKRIAELGKSIEVLNKEIESAETTHAWLNKLILKIQEE